LARPHHATYAFGIDHLDAGGAARLDHDARDRAPLLHLERRQVALGEIAPRRGVAQVVAGVFLDGVHAVLGFPVVVGVDRHAELVGTRSDEALGGVADVGVLQHLDGPALAAVFAGRAGPVFHALVGLQDVFVAPALVALGLPGVEILLVAAHEDHAVDGAGAAHHLAAPRRQSPAERVLLRHHPVA